MKTLLKLATLAALSILHINATPAVKPKTSVRVVTELNVGQTREITLTNGERVNLN